MKRQAEITVMLLLPLLLSVIMTAQFNPATATQQLETLQGWKVRDCGGYCSETNGTIRVWSDKHDEGVALYKEISPQGDFEFSLQVNAAKIDGFGIFIGNNSFFDYGNRKGVSFEFHHHGADGFLMARRVWTTNWATGQFEDIWDYHMFTYGRENVWYTMKLTVKAEPFTVKGEVFDENGTSLGAYAVSDMNDLTFKELQIIGFMNWWGGDYYVRNISDITTITSDPSLNVKMASQISINPEVSATTLGVPLNIKGQLVDSNGDILANEIVVLSYAFQGINEWIPISSTYTDTTGEYKIQWINTATGYFTLKAEYIGNKTLSGCSNTTNLNILPYEDNKTFFVQSNSTITALSFNSTSSELAFSVTGPSGTRGYTQVFLNKDLILDPENFMVALDGKQLEHIIAPLGDSWLITIYYSHSTHEISMQFQSKPTDTLNQNELLWMDLAVGVACIALVSINYSKK
ncbi:MAG: hypothetical protein ACFCUE_15130 [Candidatus Bathyarchaeia archaeon]|jgi:hypothetical protein